MSEQIDRVTRFFANLRASSMHLVDEFYHPECTFIDPVGEHRGIDSVRRYYRGLYQNVTEISFEFDTIIEQGQRCAAPWVMHLKASKLNRGNPIALPGISHIVFDQERGQAIYHRDYFDMGAFVYEHVPILGSVVRFAKERLKSD